MNRKERLDLLKINEISIEAHSFCNRKCPWCSNSVYPRDCNYNEMDESVFNRLIDEIRDNREYFDDQLTIASCRYNEPFYNGELAVKRLNYIKEQVPYCSVQTNTNGDFLTKDIFEQLKIDRVNILDYDMRGIPTRLKRLKEWGIKVYKIDKNNHRIFGDTKNKTHIVYRADFLETSKLQDRGGVVKDSKFEWADKEWESIQKKERDFPCYMVMTTVSIDWTGDVFLCYNVRYDVPDHKDFCVGNIYKDSFLDILNGEKTKEVRKLASMWSDFPDTCKTCSNKRDPHEILEYFYDEY